MTLQEELQGFLSTAQVGKVLDITPERVRQLADAGRLPSLSTALGRLFRKEDVDALKASRGPSA